MVRRSTPKFIYFDLGNVLLHFDHHRAARQMAEVAGIAFDLAWQAVFESGLEWRFESGEIDETQFYQQFCEQTRTTPDKSLLHRAATDIFTLNAPVIPIVAGLSDRGFALGILSNTNSAHWDFVSDGRYAEIIGYFSTHALSYRLGAMKPDPAIYASASNLAGVEPAEIFFVDDRPENVEGARAAGIDAELFTTAHALMEQLLERGAWNGVPPTSEVDSFRPS